MDLSKRLAGYAAGDVYPFHMPGHKRNPAFAAFVHPYELDITEIDGFDNLHDAHGLLAGGMARAAALWGSRRAFYLVGGSTCGILAGIAAVTRRGDRVLVARGSHRSVYNALMLGDLRPAYLLPAADPATGITGALSPDSVEQALKKQPDVRLVVVTSPTYEGVISDIAGIADTVHRYGALLLVDEAHGAHLGLAGGFPSSSVQAGADIVVQSLHKTLPSLTQTALLHIGSGRVDGDEVARQLAVFETSSPSYPLMASIDACVSLLEREREALFSAYRARLETFDRQILPLRHLKVPGHGGDPLSAHPTFFGLDPGKLILSCRGTSLTGPRLASLLRETYHLEMEMAMGDYALAMTSICDTGEGFGRLAAALLDIDGQLTRQSLPPAPAAYPLPPARLLMQEALALPGRMHPLPSCAGGISREFVWAYPPGIPLLVPGEEVTPSLLELFDGMTSAGVALKSTRGQMPHALELAEG